MRQLLVIAIIASLIMGATSFYSNEKNLREIYSGPPSTWPRPHIDKSVQWTELGVLPKSPVDIKIDTIREQVELGKFLFFDKRLSGSGKISCASCHQPKLSWSDGLPRSAGHEGQLNKRNAPTIQNVWFYRRLFWDGRSHSLEDQAFAPINSESEMHSDMRTLPANLRKIKAYDSLFMLAFGTPGVDPDRIATALAMFQRTVISSKSRFDLFLQGDREVLTSAELRGMHIFRTRARCMNCHHGSLFTDNDFHNNGFAGKDKGLYMVTHLDADSGKFKTPSLRDVTKTGPWMHDGTVSDLALIIDHYNKGGNASDKLLKPLGLSRRDKRDLLAFLHAISGSPAAFTEPLSTGP